MNLLPFLAAKAWELSGYVPAPAPAAPVAPNLMNELFAEVIRRGVEQATVRNGGIFSALAVAAIAGHQAIQRIRNYRANTVRLNAMVQGLPAEVQALMDRAAKAKYGQLNAENKGKFDANRTFLGAQFKTTKQKAAGLNRALDSYLTKQNAKPVVAAAAAAEEKAASPAVEAAAAKPEVVVVAKEKAPRQSPCNKVSNFSVRSYLPSMPARPTLSSITSRLPAMPARPTMSSVTSRLPSMPSFSYSILSKKAAAPAVQPEPVICPAPVAVAPKIDCPKP